MSRFPRQYRQKTSRIFPIFFGAVLFFIGLVFLLLLPALAPLVLLAAVAVPAAIWYFATDQTITCTETGFTVETSSRRAGARREEYAWTDVTDTRYSEWISDGERGSRTHGAFEVDTRRGPAFKVGHGTPEFSDMIATFNARTLHLPHLWIPRNGMAVGIGPVTLSRGAYQRVERAALARQG